MADAPVMTPKPRFVHLHLHSEYSLLDGGNRLKRLVERVRALGMDAVAVTDHGNLHGAVEFYHKAREAGIKPILGIEAYVAPGDRSDRTFTGVQDGGFHLVLLAENQTGWQNLLKLSSDAFLHGFYYRPRMDKTTLRQWSKGLIAINGHLGSSLAAHLLRFVQTGQKAHYEKAVEEALFHKETFGVNEAGEPCFYIELQRHEVQEQLDINPHLIQLARELDLPLVCDNDAHFLTADDWDTHDTLCCISMGKLKQEQQRLRYPRELYVKGPEQMAELFADLPEAVENTLRIAQRCDVKLDFSQNHAPVVKVICHALPDKTQGLESLGLGNDSDWAQAFVRSFACEHPLGSTEWFKAFCGQFELLPYNRESDQESPAQLKAQCDAALRLLAEAGAIWRYGPQGVDEAKRQRLERELTVLADKLISAYFLIVWDFVNEARRRGIPSNARGSGVGTMVGYVLGLSNACPVQYGLLFERFTDPDRAEYPDIDVDICQDGRQAIIEYVRQKYGHVAQIITFNVMKAKAAIRDVGRVLGMPLAEVDKVCKLIGDGLGVTLDDALNQEPDLRRLVDESPMHREVVETARRLEGMARHAGVHAAGVIVATQPLDNIVPLYKPADGDNIPIVTQWDGPTCEKVGLLKMDFLGLRTLSIIERAKLLIRQTLDERTIRATIDPEGKQPADWDPLDLERLSYDDKRVLDLFRRGETAGVFQFESGGMRNMLLAMKPDRLEDLIAANALYRPGPMDLIPDYCDRKQGRAPVPKVHPIADKYTAETYGVMTYQEQIMQIVHELGDIPLRQAYTLIKAISKKKHDVINANREQFAKGAQEKGVSRQQAEELFEVILKFAGYGFNKSHSTGYAIVAYQTAYLKTYFPVQYMAALLTYESVSTEKVVEYMDECRRVLFPDGHRGIEVKPPSISHSAVGFTPVFDDNEPRDANHGHIRFGLGAVKGVGEKAIRGILEAREKGGPFQSLYDFCERVPLNLVNRATIEALIKCGAFDDVHGAEQRAALGEALDGAIAAGQSAATDRSTGQLNFFGAFAEEETASPVAAAVKLPEVVPWSNKERLDHEKAVLGLYVSSHPLNEHLQTIQRFGTAAVADVAELAAEVAVTIGGMLTRVRPTFVKNGRSAGQKMAMITLEDKTGSLDGVVFADTYAIIAPLLETDRIVFLQGKIDRRREEPCLVVNQVVPVERAAEELTQVVKIILREGDGGRDGHPTDHGGRDGRPTGNGNGSGHGYNGELANLKTLLRQAQVGRSDRLAEVVFEVHQAGQVVNLRVNGLRVGVTRDLAQRVDTVMHRPGSCTLLGAGRLLRSRAAATRILHDQNAAPQERLRRPSSDEEVCASIDRY